jgi:peptidoglycan/LPS O-acetylase OafA/YrhL
MTIGCNDMKKKTLYKTSREMNLLSQSHYPMLNELRAIAVLCVIMGHVEQIKQLNFLPYNYWFPIPGILGVTLFFALSGFLITALLLKAKYQYREVNLKSFYIKRILRIWPLYFFMLLLSIFMINKIEYFQLPHYSFVLYGNLNLKNILLLLLVLPNFIDIIIPYASHLWSIGIEAQFYWVQPFIVKTVKHIEVLAGVMLCFIFLKEILIFCNTFINLEEINNFIVRTTAFYGSIAIGCLGAILCYSKPNFVKNFIHHKITQIFALISFGAFLVAINMTNHEHIVDLRFHALVFTIIIINAATNPTSICTLANKPLDYIGRISYGIYIYHIFGVGIAIAIVRSFLVAADNRVWFDLLVYFLTLCLTFFISAISYHYFENYFMRFKKNLAP